MNEETTSMYGLHCVFLEKKKKTNVLSCISENNGNEGCHTFSNYNEETPKGKIANEVAIYVFILATLL